MTLQVISAGFGRTGTMSLKIALETLGFGPCHHMEEVVANGPTQVPLWEAALAGTPDFSAIYNGYNSAVDWPTAAFWKELADAYPDAKIILSSRSAESWYNSFSETLLATVQDTENWPAPARPWFEMATKVLKRSLGDDWSRDAVMAAFNVQEARVKAALSPERLLVHAAKDGWEPLCQFLGCDVPAEPYPRTNSKEEFFELMRRSDDM